MQKNLSIVLVVILVCSLLNACSNGGIASPEAGAMPTPTLLSNFLPQNGLLQGTEPPGNSPEAPTQGVEPAVVTEQPGPNDGRLVITVDPQASTHAISPLIYGLSGGDQAYHQSLGSTLGSWGGNPSTRYNWKLGNAWNAGKDWFYQNGNYGNPDGVSVADKFFDEAKALGRATRLAVPTLGWVAKDTYSCSFPKSDGSCGDGNGSTCEKPDETANPETANTLSTPETIAEWIRHLQERNTLPTYVAMDNEPEVWGITHYDVHPTCTTYEEILEKYLAYATAVRSAEPNIKIAGPVTCCWFSYWNIAPGPESAQAGKPQDFIPWFLSSVRSHDEASGQRSIDALDVHFYPQGGVYNENTDPDTNALRLRTTRALWDPNYIDESWINQPIYFIPRLKEVISQYYPGLELGISEWNWGADTDINGALAIAEVLGIFGREGVDYAAYWRNPPQDSPGFLAFKLFTNYDENGSRFEGASVPAQSNQPDTVSSYAALDERSGELKLILINKDPGKSAEANIKLTNYLPNAAAVMYRLDAVNSKSIRSSEVAEASGSFTLSLPPYSISLIVFSGQP